MVGIHANLLRRYERRETLQFPFDLLEGNPDLKFDKDIINRIIDIQSLFDDEKSTIF